MPSRKINLSETIVGVLVDIETCIPGTVKLFPGTMDHYVWKVLKKKVRKVFLIPYTNPEGLIEFIKANSIQAIFNLTEHADGNRAADSSICSLLELLKIPYTGTGPKGLTLCRDKAISKMIAVSQGFHAPDFFVIHPGTDDIPAGLSYPVIVKPRYGDSSEGIHIDSVVFDSKALKKQISELKRQGIKEIICEKFISGREISIGIVNGKIMPPRELTFDKTRRGIPMFATYQEKHNKETGDKVVIRSKFAKLTAKQKAAVFQLSRRAFEALEMKSYGRFDLILSGDKDWYFLEANANSDISPYKKTRFGIWSIWSAINYETMIESILMQALQQFYKK